MTEISIHALLAESDQAGKHVQWPTQPISIHALLAESDVILSTRIIGFLGFLSTLSLRRATYLVRGQRPNWGISIHALLAESDNGNLTSHCSNDNFYPRSPCGERRQLV